MKLHVGSCLAILLRFQFLSQYLQRVHGDQQGQQHQQDQQGPKKEKQIYLIYSHAF